MKLEQGMLLLDPGTERSSPPNRAGIYTVSSPKVLIQHLGDCSVKSTLTKPELPKGWIVLGNRALAKQLVEQYKTQ